MNCIFLWNPFSITDIFKLEFSNRFERKNIKLRKFCTHLWYMLSKGFKVLLNIALKVKSKSKVQKSDFSSEIFTMLFK